MLDMEGHICIVDFGLCKTGLGINAKTGTFCGSLEYMAPEVLEGKEYSKDIDWWALATMVYEMIEGIPPFWDEDQDLMLENISRCNIADLLKLNYKFSRECKDFITSTLNIEPTKRLGYGENGTQDIKNHPWFADIDWIKLYNKQVEPIFKPHLENESDTRYFDEEVTAEDPHVPNFNSNIEKLDLEDDPFDDFSFEEPKQLITPVKTPSRRARPNKNRRSTPMKVGMKSPPKPQPVAPKFFEPEINESAPEVVRTKTPKKPSEAKPPRKDSTKSPVKDLSASAKKNFDLSSIEIALSQSEKSPRKSPRNIFQTKGTPTKEEKKPPMVAKKLSSKSDQTPVPVISVDYPVVSSVSLASSHELKLPEDSIAKTGRKLSHGIKPVSLAPVLHRHVRTKSASSAVHQLEGGNVEEVVVSPRRSGNAGVGGMEEEDKQNCLIS
uniref:Protein kinase domain-containing protein n=1 Tax=Arcella intermedia TaxID=1963864 RepID=A0A6B2L420_9EUKA